MYLAVKNWDKHQKAVKPDRRKEFIALHTAVLDDPEFRDLPQEAQVLLIQCWLLRGRTEKNIPYNTDFLTGIFGRCNEDTLQWLIEDGWLIETNEKSPPKPKITTAQRKSPKEINYKAHYTDDFESWWETYPKKRSKMDAFVAWEQVEQFRPPVEELIAKTEAYAESVKGRDQMYTKYPAGWLRDRRWEDDLRCRRKYKGADINRIIDREQVDHFAHPKWKTYVESVVAGEVKPGFKEYLSATD